MRPITTEQTSKLWKAPQAIGGGLMAVTLCALLCGVARLSTALLPLVVGVGLYTIGRLGAWWCHG